MDILDHCYSIGGADTNSCFAAIEAYYRIVSRLTNFGSGTLIASGSSRMIKRTLLYRRSSLHAPGDIKLVVSMPTNICPNKHGFLEH